MAVVFPAKIQVHRILRVQALDPQTGARTLELDGGQTAQATIGHLGIRVPVAGDYWVVPSEGNSYTEPKSRFQLNV